MSGTGFDMKEVSKARPGSPAVSRAILFIIPSIIAMVVSILLFNQLSGLSATQMNVFSITVISAIILSLIGMAGMQILVYRIVDDREYFKDGASIRAIRVGTVYSLVFFLICSAVFYPFFTSVLSFSRTDYLFFAMLLFMYSFIWVLSSAFWATEKYAYPAIIFSISYVAMIALTLVAYNMNHAYTILGYTAGTAVLLIFLWIISMMVFRKPGTYPDYTSEFSKVWNLASHNKAVILFNLFYVIAIFLDKIIVWVYQGFLITGTYGQGAFLGMLPMFSIAVLVYFSKKTKLLSDERYNGTFAEIQKGIIEYKKIYKSNIRAMLIIALAIFALTASLSVYFRADAQILKVLTTTSLGSIFFSVIIFNSSVLPIFGKNIISTIAVLVIVVFEIFSVRFVAFDVWYASIGFLLGSFAGCVISVTSVMLMFYSFEYHMYRFLLHSN